MESTLFFTLSPSEEANISGGNDVKTPPKKDEKKPPYVKVLKYISVKDSGNGGDVDITIKKAKIGKVGNISIDTSGYVNIEA